MIYNNNSNARLNEIPVVLVLFKRDTRNNNDNDHIVATSSDRASECVSARTKTVYTCFCVQRYWYEVVARRIKTRATCFRIIPFKRNANRT